LPNKGLTPGTLVLCTIVKKNIYVTMLLLSTLNYQIPKLIIHKVSQQKQLKGERLITVVNRKYPRKIRTEVLK